MAQSLLIFSNGQRGKPLPSLSTAFRPPFLSSLPFSRTPAAAQYLSYLIALHLHARQLFLERDISKIARRPDWRRDHEVGVGGWAALGEGERRVIEGERRKEGLVEEKLLEVMLDLVLMRRNAREEK